MDRQLAVDYLFQHFYQDVKNLILVYYPNAFDAAFKDVPEDHNFNPQKFANVISNWIADVDEWNSPIANYYDRAIAVSNNFAALKTNEEKFAWLMLNVKWK